jgi:general secretion pathway protein A
LVVLDEAQSLSFAVLEQLRLLTNLVTDERKFIQIWLIGQPELRAMLAMPETNPLSQRVVARYHLGTLHPADTADYIRHRLAVAGYQGPDLFDMDAVLSVHSLCRGIPRRINLLCTQALALAALAGDTDVQPTHVTQAAHLVFDDPTRRATLPPPLSAWAQARHWARWSLGAALLLGGLVLGWRVVSFHPPASSSNLKPATHADFQNSAPARSLDR